MLWQKIKDNNFSNKKFSNVVITGGGSQLDNIEKYVEQYLLVQQEWLILKFI